MGEGCPTQESTPFWPPSWHLLTSRVTFSKTVLQKHFFSSTPQLNCAPPEVTSQCRLCSSSRSTVRCVTVWVSFGANICPLHPMGQGPGPSVRCSVSQGSDLALPSATLCRRGRDLAPGPLLCPGTGCSLQCGMGAWEPLVGALEERGVSSSFIWNAFIFYLQS